MPALIYDCDGVLADTERYGHLPAFNKTFEEFGLPVRWSEEDYAEKLLIGGGKERMSTMLTPEFIAAAGLPANLDELAAHVAEWHRRKTEIYTEIIASGTIPPRPGVRRLTEEAADAGWSLAVASTSAEASVRSVLRHTVGEKLASRFEVFAGDVVAKKKPAPDIYRLAVDTLQIPASSVIVVEDSRNGWLAALAAGLTCVVTTSSYTIDEDFTGAGLVVSSLGDVTEPLQVNADPFGLDPTPCVRLDHLTSLLTGAAQCPAQPSI
ncbi:HAD-IA family hydrolase [Nocardia pseudovaccinii]|uniref:HAD-IA family hydrolase n=1 Tax=Nocardia pseudovaccinii TaxID=189540 RepID=UPI003D903BD2